MAELTPEEKRKHAWSMIGMDTDRQWATGVSVMPGGRFVILVFKEQLEAADADNPEEEPVKMARNIGSVVMPVEVARELGTIIRNLLGDDGDTEEKAG